MKPMNQKYPFLQYLNSYSKVAVTLLVMLPLGTSSVYGITMNGVYFGTCERDIGVIVNADESHIQLLTLPGIIKRISRFDIIYLADYPLGNIPIRSVQNTETKPVTIINTLVNFKPQELVRGWPIDFSDQSILFLTTAGDELVISRDDIYSVKNAEGTKQIDLTNATKAAFYYYYPALFNHCQSERSELKVDTAENEVYPQQLIGNALLVKSTLDHLMEGHKLIKDYKRNQKFYAVPIIYTNDTHIGVWYNYNSRHGASDSRNNSAIPFIISDQSDGPFGFQRRITTGSWLMPYSVHEEPQTLFSYALKADYFHFSVMFDPSIILSGSNYQWKKNELETYDDRITEIFHLAFGFDYNHFSFEIALPIYNIGVRNDEYFANDRAAMFRYGLMYRNQFIETNLYFGRGTSETENDSNADRNQDEENTSGHHRNQLTTGRLNFALNYLGKLRPSYSLIYRKYVFHRDPDVESFGSFDYQSTSFTNFFSLGYRFDNDITVSGYISHEYNQLEYDKGDSGSAQLSKQHYKVGGSIMLTF